jgi:hypothetical protein
MQMTRAYSDSFHAWQYWHQKRYKKVKTAPNPRVLRETSLKLVSFLKSWVNGYTMCEIRKKRLRTIHSACLYHFHVGSKEFFIISQKPYKKSLTGNREAVEIERI